MPIPPARAAYDLWRYEFDLTDQLLSRLEIAERAKLRELGCPTDAASVFAILNGERPAPWPKRTAARARQRARNAMAVLALVPQIRAHLSFGHENSQRAVYLSLLAASYASDAAVNAMLAAATRQGGRKGGQKTGQNVTLAAAETDKTIRRFVARWRASEELRDQYDSATSYVQSQTHLSLRTVQRHFARLGLSRRASRSA
jgi:hypothetical protein